ncbi:MAG: 3-oxoacyl-[acyl-carrier-protein] synthase III C-terminal domain-containing protein [Chthoniobacterales bacterium]
MYLQSLASAFPDACYTQRECWEFFRPVVQTSLNRRSVKVLETVLNGASGIDTRHFALAPSSLFGLDAQALNHAFEREAPILASKALEKACHEAGVLPASLDALFVCTCSGYLCPGVSSHLAEKAGLRSDTFLSDLGGLGCGAAIPLMHAAGGFLALHPDALVATVAVEICSAAFYLDDDDGVLVSACLFGDGASAALWRGRDAGGQWKASHFRSVHLPENREAIRFVNAGGKLRNQLHKTVPQIAGQAVEDLYAQRTGTPDCMITHTGGRDVITEIEKRFPQYPLTDTRETLRKYGNLSSPSVLVALEQRLAKIKDEDYLWLASFGAGFAAHSCELKRTAKSNL